MSYIDYGGSKTAFNMAMLHYEKLNQLMVRKSQAFIDGELDMIYECLEEIYTMVEFKLNSDEEKKVKGLFQEIRLMAPKDFLPPVVYAQSQVMAKDHMRALDRTIMRFMDKYDMIFPKIDSRSGLDKLQQKYGTGEKK